jgi:hypothetical protein
VSRAIQNAIEGCETVLRRAHNLPFLNRMRNEHGNNVSAWWQHDPPRGSELDVAQYCFTTAAVAAVARHHLTQAQVIHVAAADALALCQPIAGPEDVSAMGIRIRLAHDPMYLDLTDDGLPQPMLTVPRLSPPTVVVGALAWQPGGLLNIVPFVRAHDFDEPWAHILWDAEKKLDEPSVAHAGLHVFGAPDVGLFNPSVSLDSNSLTGRVFAGVHSALGAILPALDALTSGNAHIVPGRGGNLPMRLAVGAN